MHGPKDTWTKAVPEPMSGIRLAGNFQLATRHQWPLRKWPDGGVYQGAVHPATFFSLVLLILHQPTSVLFR